MGQLKVVPKAKMFQSKSSVLIQLLPLLMLTNAHPAQTLDEQVDPSCECSVITLLDKKSGLHIGNCLTPYEKRTWCYVSSTSTCSDGKESSSREGLFYSFEACNGIFNDEPQPQQPGEKNLLNDILKSLNLIESI